MFSFTSKTINEENFRKQRGKCFNELQILLYEIKLVLNSKPLGFVYDKDLQEILTPNHLLFGRKL